MNRDSDSLAAKTLYPVILKPLERLKDPQGAYSRKRRLNAFPPQASRIQINAREERGMHPTEKCLTWRSTKTILELPRPGTAATGKIRLYR